MRRACCGPGAAGVFFHYAAFYYLGRRLLGAPLPAALFALLTGVTVWVNFGTYWGFGSGDITPRVFYAALFPLLLAATLSALDKPQLRPIILFVSGCGMYLHGISSLVASCMLFTVFFFHRAPNDSLRRHCLWLLLSLLAWSVPTLAFLCSSIKTSSAFSAQELAALQHVFGRRFLEDEGNRWHRLISHLHYASDSFPLLLGGVAGFFIVRRCGTPVMKRLASIVPTLFLGVCTAVLLSVAETSLAERLHRLPLGSELLRGVRFVVLLCWLMILCAFILPVAGAPPAGRRHRPGRRVGLRAGPSIRAAGPVGGGTPCGMPWGCNSRPPYYALRAMPPITDRPCRPCSALYRRRRPFLRNPTPWLCAISFTGPWPTPSRTGLPTSTMKTRAGRRAGLTWPPRADTLGLTATWLASGAAWILCGDMAESENIARHGRIVWSNDRWFIARRDLAPETPLQ